MKILNGFSPTLVRVAATTVFAGASVLALAIPSFAHAATYAFVTSGGEVNAVVADTWMQAIANAVNIDVHSGVLLLSNPNDAILNLSF